MKNAKSSNREPGTANREPPPIIVFPLFRQKSDKGLTAEQLEAEKRKQRELIRRHASNPGLRAMFNMVERLAARLQASAIDSSATPHTAGTATGAGYIYNVLRTVLEGTEAEDEEPE